MCQFSIIVSEFHSKVWVWSILVSVWDWRIWTPFHKFDHLLISVIEWIISCRLQEQSKGHKDLFPFHWMTKLDMLSEMFWMNGLVYTQCILWMTFEWTGILDKSFTWNLLDMYLSKYSCWLFYFENLHEVKFLLLIVKIGYTWFMPVNVHKIFWKKLIIAHTCRAH